MEAGTEVHLVRRIREFNRFYTRVIGVLEEGLLHTPYSLTEARVIFELAQRDSTEVGKLRRLLGLDAGYLSRVLTRFETSGLLTKQRSPQDGRRQSLALTDAGRDLFATLDTRSMEEIRTLLTSLTGEDRRRLVDAMDTIRDVLGNEPRSNSFVLRAPQPGDLGWVVQRHGELYAEEYGWDARFEALVAGIVAGYAADHDSTCENAWIAEVDGQRAGCVFCVRKDDTTAQLRLLLVEPRTRGMGVGSRLVEECLRFARRARYERIMLWTNSVLEDARRIYQRAGFELREEAPHHSFGHDLVEQIWWREL
jgi:DNA-binding MarR family transcriptional regulator/N-acetylglutamate synthase-like GNAT family acetyltransferase